MDRAPAPQLLVTLTVEQHDERVRHIVLEALAEMTPSGAVADPLLDRSGAAKWLKISLAKLDQLCRREADPLPYSLCGDARRFEREELRAWLRRQRAGGAP